MTSTGKVTVGQPAPAFKKFAVVDGCIKGVYTVWYKFWITVTDKRRHISQLLPHGDPGIQLTFGRIPVQPQLRGRLRQHRQRVLPQSMKLDL
jgi:hypothetical protein